MENNPNIARSRDELATRNFDQGFHWRILFLGRSVNGSTDIVSCLSRSLRNLGHRVLDIDFKRHRGVIVSPTRAQGGHGPIYIEITPLESMLQRFRPQMIVCCAGGLTFRPEDAEALKRRGIVLVGLTLSDPDVFPSIAPHAHVFDFHTTNARVALPMYRDAGLANTLYFPFGIDRGFVTQSVPRAPELAADVICIGHATARPERNGIMKRVARDLDVRTYGRGWELPGSEVVAGRRMVQASREGLVHVNFPLTRAGFINIKCGVFESVGSGALVATGRFDEMADFFEYDEEIIGYVDEDDLVKQVQRVLSDPGRYRAMTERAFDRLINHHLYEHRWMTLFEDILTAARSGASWLGRTREQQVLETLSESIPRAKHVLLSGFYGASNVGDELILRSIAERIEAADTSSQVWVAAENPEQVERNHGLQSFPRRALPEALHAARTASAIVLGGGGLWHDYTFERSGGLLGLFHAPQISIAGFGALPLLGRMFDVPFHVVGMGIGPLTDSDAKRMVRFLAGHAESILVRDTESADHAAQVCPHPDRVKQAPDVVYGLELPELSAPAEIVEFRSRGYRVVGLNLRPWAQADEDALVDCVAAGLVEASAGGPIALVGIPMQAGARFDSLILSRVASKLGSAVPTLLLKAPMSADMLIATLGSIDVLVSMRLHASLLAHRLGRPVVGIAYDPKVANHFAELQRSPFCLQLPLEAKSFSIALERALSEGEGLPGDVLALLRNLECRAAQALDEVAVLISAAPTRPSVFEVPRLDDPSALAAPPAPYSRKVDTAPIAQVPEGAWVPCRFADRSHATAGSVTLPEAARTSVERTLLVWLPTEMPTQGDAMEAQGFIDLTGEGDVELAMTLVSPYQNPKALGRIRSVLQIGEKWRLVEDLAVDARQVQIRMFARAPARIPVTLSVNVERTCFASQAWPRVSRVELHLRQAVASSHGCSLQIVTSRGNPVDPSSVFTVPEPSGSHDATARSVKVAR